MNRFYRSPFCTSRDAPFLSSPGPPPRLFRLSLFLSPSFFSLPFFSCPRFLFITVLSSSQTPHHHLPAFLSYLFSAKPLPLFHAPPGAKLCAYLPVSAFTPSPLTFTFHPPTPCILLAIASFSPPIPRAIIPPLSHGSFLPNPFTSFPSPASSLAQSLLLPSNSPSICLCRYYIPSPVLAKHSSHPIPPLAFRTFPFYFPSFPIFVFHFSSFFSLRLVFSPQPNTFCKNNILSHNDI